MDIGLVGGILGSIFGVLGGIIGTYATLRNTNGPRERAFAVKGSIVAGGAISLFLLCLFLLPPPWNLLIWIPYGVFLPLGIRKWNTTQQRIREEEAATNRNVVPE